MPVDKQYVGARITETLPGVWLVKLKFSWCRMYNYDESFVETSLDRAIYRCLVERWGSTLRITNNAGVDIDLSEILKNPAEKKSD